MTTRTVLAALAIGVAGLAWTAGCETQPKTAEQQSTLSSEVQATLQAFKNADSTLQGVMDRAVGYAVLPDVGKAGFIVGGAGGQGEVYEGGRLIGYTSLRQGTVGLQAGAQTYSQLIVFLTQDQMDKFKNERFSFAANASAVAIKAGAAAAADYSGGVLVFVRSKGGLMAEAAIGGQQFTFRPL